MKKLPQRSELKVKDTWDLTLLFETEELYNKALVEIKSDVDDFNKKYEGTLNTPQNIVDCLNELKSIHAKIIKVGAYQSLNQSAEGTKEENQLRSSSYSIFMQDITKKTNFVSNELDAANDSLLKEAIKLDKENSKYLSEIIDYKKHSLSKETENALSSLSGPLNLPYTNYLRFKLVDMSFDDFKAGKKKYPNSFTLFENDYQADNNTELRREAHKAFYDVLKKYQNGFASNYYGQVLKEKQMADLRGFNSVFDYLLYSQKVPKSFMDRQIDLIMGKLAPKMREYAKLIKEIHGLDQMTYADLKISIDPAYEAKISINQAKKYALDGLQILGPEYMKMVKKSFKERWIDFPQSVGKSTGGFCSSPYGCPSYILINWNGQMDEVMVLAHELGHAGHFQYANKYQNIFNTRPSMYFIEAPSTVNELIMSQHLIKNADDLRLRRWLLSVMISRTYYHNFITHLLEAAFQRKVYELVDNKKPISANILNNIKLSVIKEFWGEDVVVDDYAGLTWMRQPHYFMGLYPYTYSAGLTIGTYVAKKLFNNELDPKEWIKVLKAGGTKSPLELAKMVGCDISTDKPLLETIDFVNNAIDEIIDITKKLG